MNRRVRLLVPLCLVVVLGGCGPLGVGLGLNELFSDDPAPDLVNPTVSFLRESGAPVGPFETTTDVTFRIVRNKSNVRVRALVVGAGRVADAGPLDREGCPDVALFGAEIPGGELALAGLQDLSSYTVFLRGEDPSGRIDCTTHTFFVDSRPPEAPVVLRVEANRARELNVRWTRPVDAGSGVAGYRIYYDLGGRSIPDARPRVPGQTYVPATFIPAGLGGSVAVPYVEGAANVSFTLQGLFACRQHYIQVAAVDFAGNESPLMAEREVARRTRAGGDGTFRDPYAVGLGGTYFDVGDVNGDGLPDVVTSADNRTVTAFGTAGADGKPSATFVRGERFSSGGAMTLGDVDGDHELELVGVSGVDHDGDFGATGLAELEPGDRGGIGGTELPVSRVRVVDLEGDGPLEIASTWDGSVRTFDGGPAISGPGIVYDFCTGDFDGDGLLDVAGTFRGAVRIGTYSGDTYQVGVGADPFGVGAGDFNGDGNVDLATANRDGSLSVVLGNGDGTFRALWTLVVGTKAGRVTVSDFDDDDVLDLVIGDSLPDAVVVLRGNGDGTFASTHTATLPATVCDVVIHDMDRDGIRDIVALTPGESYVLTGRGARGRADGQFVITSEIADGGGALRFAGGDFNEDGIPDVTGVEVVGEYGPNPAFDGPVTVLMGVGVAAQGTGVLGGRTTTAASGGYPVVADFDGDRHLDILSGTRLLRGVGNGTFLAPITALSDDPFANRKAPEAVDFDGDGALDIAAMVGGNVSIYFGELLNGKRTGTFATPVTIVNAPGSSIAVGDVNDDRRPDLIFEINTSLELMLGNGDGTFQDPVQIAQFDADNLLTFIVDVDGDPWPDLIVNDFESDLWLLRGKRDSNGYATGQFEAPVRIGAEGEADLLFGLTCRDVTGDGIPDLLTTSAQTMSPEGRDTIRLWVGKGDTTFESPTSLPSNGFNPLLVDLNADGIDDIVTGRQRELVVLTGSGVVVGD